MPDQSDTQKDAAYQTFAIIRVLAAAALAVVVMVGLTFALGYLDRLLPQRESGGAIQPADAEAGAGEPLPIRSAPGQLDGPAAKTDTTTQIADPPVSPHPTPAPGPGATPAQPFPAAKPGATQSQAAAPPAAQPEPAHEAAPLPPGVAFVQALIEPLAHELNHRWWGWRPNDILNFTDNVNNFQLGVLEVTRRATVQLAERLSRTGSTAAFNTNLENAMNWLMISADRYWFPSAESKYKESLAGLAAYKQQLSDNKATFYTRTDNLIPLLVAFEDLLGSSDEILVKAYEKDGSKVSYFKADDHFYYAKGTASAMLTILEAVYLDFHDLLEKRNGAELLHHAIESCRRAAELNPWIITNGELDGLMANHRANMAAPISHAKFYLTQLIKTIST